MGRNTAAGFVGLKCTVLVWESSPGNRYSNQPKAAPHSEAWSISDRVDPTAQDLPQLPW